MKKYQPFVDDLSLLVESFPGAKLDILWNEKAIASINGLASRELRTRISLEDRRNSGAFFTDAALTEKILQIYELRFGPRVAFYDPACGAGNLLIAVKAHYERRLKEEQDVCIEILGTDIHEEFVNASKHRASIYDLVSGLNNHDYSQKFSVADGLQINPYYQLATHIITNPPFNQIEAPDRISWASGKVSAAAVFIYAIIENVNPNTEIIAILPDVLRSGSRYEKWREHVSKYCDVIGVNLHGQFDAHTDVDVFSILLKKRLTSAENVKGKWHDMSSETSRISDFFSVSVGSVVDNRDAHEGVKRPYLVSKGLEGWVELKRTFLTRKHNGKSVDAPFVVVKRTSRRGDSRRAIATIISIPEPVYVDNHLIVLKPKVGGLNSCKKLLRFLNSQATDTWLDDRIRCRHLTVKIVSEMPYF